MCVFHYPKIYRFLQNYEAPLSQYLMTCSYFVSRNKKNEKMKKCASYAPPVPCRTNYLGRKAKADEKLRVRKSYIIKAQYTKCLVSWLAVQPIKAQFANDMLRLVNRLL